MKGIICLDESNGMMFFNKRQTRDLLQRRNLQAYVRNQKIYMNDYSYSLYQDIDFGNIVVCEDYWEQCEEDAYCLFENNDWQLCADKLTELVVYQWNRRYPSNVQFDVKILENFQVKDSSEFAGSVHKKITRTIYVKE